MALPRHIFAPAFRHRRLGQFFTLFVGILVYIATFAMAAEATLSTVTWTWDKGMESRLTIEIPAVDDESSTPQAERVKQVVAILQAMPEIAEVKPLPDDEALRLLKPWISQPELLKAIPIPALIDIRRNENSKLTAADVQARIKNAAPDARVDDHAVWLSDMGRLVKGLAIMAALVIALAGLTLLLAVSLVCRAIMATEHETLALLHTMGAEDDDIARHFQFHAQRLAAPAAWGGFFLSLLSAGALIFFLRHIADPSSLQPLHWIALFVAVFLVPLAAIAMAAFAARASTLKLLHAMP